MLIFGRFSWRSLWILPLVFHNREQQLSVEIVDNFVLVWQKPTVFNKNPHVFATEIVDKHVDNVDKPLQNF